MADDEDIDRAIKAFEAVKYEFEIFKDGTSDFFLKSPDLKAVVHSVRTRLKDTTHLLDKIQRKKKEGIAIDESNIFTEITDLAGVRVLHLYHDQFPAIHAEIIKKINSKDWILDEEPKAYTWDPESVNFFKNLGLQVEMKESFYTSIHYLIRPRKETHICCEIQVRTLFEEIWGEVDHTLNYPNATDNFACREQIMVLAKLVGAGSRLVDAIFRSNNMKPQH